MKGSSASKLAQDDDGLEALPINVSPNSDDLAARKSPISYQQFEAECLNQRDYLLSEARRFLKGQICDAEDLVQITLMKALQSETFRSKLYNIGKIKPWLFVILKNTFIDYYWKKKSESALIVYPGDLEEIPYRVYNPREVESSNPISDEIVAAVKSLPPELSAVLELRAYFEYEYHEVAEALGIPIGTVMSRLYRARMKCKKVLGPIMDI